MREAEERLSDRAMVERFNPLPRVSLEELTREMYHPRRHRDDRERWRGWSGRFDRWVEENQPAPRTGQRAAPKSGSISSPAAMSKPEPHTRPSLALAAEQERVRWERDARYRANAAFAIIQARRLLFTMLATASLVAGWPASPAGLLRGALGDMAGGAEHARVCISDRVSGRSSPAP